MSIGKTGEFIPHLRIYPTFHLTDLTIIRWNYIEIRLPQIYFILPGEYKFIKKDEAVLR